MTRSFVRGEPLPFRSRCRLAPAAPTLPLGASPWDWQELADHGGPPLIVLRASESKSREWFEAVCALARVGTVLLALGVVPGVSRAYSTGDTTASSAYEELNATQPRLHDATCRVPQPPGYPLGCSSENSETRKALTPRVYTRILVSVLLRCCAYLLRFDDKIRSSEIAF